MGELQQAQAQDEFRRALRALLMCPLMAATHEDFAAVRRQAEPLRDWFAREAAWPLHIDRDGARLFKRPADLHDDTRGLTGYDRRRYALLCLACAVLERADAQITLQVLGERLMQQAADPLLASRGFTFTLRSATERRDLVCVCRTLLEHGVLQRVAGDEEHFVHDHGGAQADALYDVQRRMLANMLAAVRGPSTWSAEDAPVGFEERLHSLVDEQGADGDQGRRDALRHQLTRRLLDDPVVYTSTLDAEAQAYFTNQRGAMAARLCEATGLAPEQRAEGLALTDETGQLTDVAMPAEGTEAHATLLVAEHLANTLRTTAPAGKATPTHHRAPAPAPAPTCRPPTVRRRMHRCGDSRLFTWRSGPIWPLLAQVDARARRRGRTGRDGAGPAAAPATHPPCAGHCYPIAGHYPLCPGQGRDASTGRLQGQSKGHARPYARRPQSSGHAPHHPHHALTFLTHDRRAF
ncbi:MAG: TIGR02678 family protein [Burkholderiales bacterium]|nr:TIGR02678 family protein [Burkholderiales bacterium]